MASDVGPNLSRWLFIVLVFLAAILQAWAKALDAFSKIWDRIFARTKPGGHTAQQLVAASNISQDAKVMINEELKTGKNARVLLIVVISLGAIIAFGSWGLNTYWARALRPDMLAFGATKPIDLAGKIVDDNQWLLWIINGLIREA